MAYNRKDYYFREAKKRGVAARSIFKLEEIDEKLKLIKQGYHVLDLGAAPGSWSQYASVKIGPAGRILGVDLQEVRISLPNATFIQADLREVDVAALAAEHGVRSPFDIVMSDMAPKTTGVKITDQARSLELCELALEVAGKWLRPRGHFVCKLFHSEEFEGFRARLRARFERVEVIRPKSTRRESTEIFFVGLYFKGDGK